MKILILNTGGNILSLQNILNYCGYTTKIYNNISDLDFSNIIVLPGVGSFDSVIDKLKQQGLFDKLKDKNFLKNKKLFGICVGMQVLFDSSEEGKETGLRLIPGKIIKFPKLEKKTVLHMGWNEVSGIKLDDNINNKKFYFAHSYYADCKSEYILASTVHNLKFPSIVKNNNIVGFQFHPEKSHNNGLNLLKHFLA